MNPFTSLSRAVEREEEMDAVELDPARYARVLADLARVNLVTMARRPTLSFIARCAAARPSSRPLRILDVGFGDGDMLRTIARWGVAKGVTLDLVGIDLNPKSAAAADRQPTPLPIDWQTGDYAALAGQRWDIVISSLVAHHMTHEQRIDFIRFMESEARVGWLVNDLARARLPFIGYPVLASLMRVDPIVRRDGQLSIARSFRRREWQTLLAEAGVVDARVRGWFPWRLCIERLR